MQAAVLHMSTEGEHDPAIEVRKKGPARHSAELLSSALLSHPTQYFAFMPPHQGLCTLLRRAAPHRTSCSLNDLSQGLSARWQSQRPHSSTAPPCVGDVRMRCGCSFSSCLYHPMVFDNPRRGIPCRLLEAQRTGPRGFMRMPLEATNK